MTFNAMTERYEEITVCGKPALFTSIRIKRDTVPDGLYAKQSKASAVYSCLSRSYPAATNLLFANTRFYRALYWGWVYQFCGMPDKVNSE